MFMFGPFPWAAELQLEIFDGPSSISESRASGKVMSLEYAELYKRWTAKEAERNKENQQGEAKAGSDKGVKTA